MSESEQLLLGLAAVVVIGIGAQWFAWKLRVPSILLLLTSGILAGPISELAFAWLPAAGHWPKRLVDPDAMFGPLLFPGVAIAVALVLFEGGLSLRAEDLKRIGVPLRNLLTTGAAVTWLLSALGAHYLIGLDWSVALLLGAILVVTGPTVVQPLLRQIRPSGDVGPVAKWEGIVIDPIGAVGAVLIYEIAPAIDAGEISAIVLGVLHSLGTTCLVGGLCGALGSWILVQVLKRDMVPDYLDSPIVLLVVVAAFVTANLWVHESGLIAVTIMGIVLANQKSQVLHAVIEFKERLTILLVSSLFILLAARLEISDITGLGWQAWVFVALLILVIRPAAVALSMIGTKLNWRERVFLAWMAPRGIVAASVASIFGLAMGESAAQLAPVMFLVIICTVTTYGLTSGPLARWLGLAVASPQGVLIAGAHPLAREMATALQSSGVQVLLVDTNFNNVQLARMAGLPAQFASILSERLMNEIDLWGIGRFFALTPNVEVNSLACAHFATLFGRAEVYQLSPPSSGRTRIETGQAHLRGRVLFSQTATYETLRDRLLEGGTIKKTKITAEFDQAAFEKQYGGSAIVLFVVRDGGQWTAVTADKKLQVKSGQTVISLVDAKASSVSLASNDTETQTPVS
jgi:NhaP-type Na+/H+ or K+/H+ antiporter